MSIHSKQGDFPPKACTKLCTIGTIHNEIAKKNAALTRSAAFTGTSSSGVGARALPVLAAYGPVQPPA